ncbi:run domain Beclin-1-interacting and cysteine-rich domain-containing protein isoform X2 [Eurosta solidaginis]|uniref:run domain Beclin-1-interacting and cysteine-rich domain-containing protein isoform X2 n=1 Tax=Eurosta solidaginis TaxID=178769 RepID=UPI003530C864
MEIDLQVLLANLKKACSLWFLNEQATHDRVVEESTFTSKYDNIILTVVEILRHGLRLKEDVGTAHSSEENLSLNSTDGFKKMVDEFDWVCRSAQIRNSIASNISTQMSVSPQSIRQSSHETTPPLVGGNIEHAIEYFLHSWVARNLKANCLSACLQLLVAEKELLNIYYKEYAYLQKEQYSTALLICLSAIELNQFSLLSQIESNLYSPTTAGALTANYLSTHIKHRRSTSHPLFSISPAKNSKIAEFESDSLVNNQTVVQKSSNAELGVPIFTTFRKTKSLPILQHKPSVPFEFVWDSKTRRRSKTMLSKSIVNNPADIIKYKHTSPTSIPFVANNSSNEFSTCYSNSNTNTSTTTTTGSFSGSDFADLPLLQATASDLSDIATVNPSAASTSSIASFSSDTAACPIKLINCDDIKIWTDQTYDSNRSEQSVLQQEMPTTSPCNIPEKLETQKVKPKNSSPIGSFLCNLFSTPPKYTHWSLANQSSSCYSGNGIDAEQNASSVASAAAAVFPCNLFQNTGYSINSASGGGVFDSFMPVYGKKFRPRNSQTLFEDGISTLDYKTPASNESTKSVTKENEGAKCSRVCKTLPKYQQSLTDFLQTSQMSRNNTDLEKENAHFLVSEAIISAIEHIKWDKSTDPETKLRRRKTKVTTATDCLATNDLRYNKSRPKLEIERSRDESSEHIPYAEVDESILDSLSAEVVGLSLISKFDDKHLPKVSDLKWLVSEEDTPQQLLPIPDYRSTSNPDENVIRPLTRGTRYWAPPRQQIIFTNHPTASRKEIIQKQNTRCAGCGMRVSRQYMKSFRYCTYLGKYHCTGCHRNQISPIPAKILQDWDFKCYPVSVFSYRLLEQMYTYPLFYVPDLNPTLYIATKGLFLARKKRVQLKFVKDFVKTCRFAIRYQAYFDSIPEHITNDPDIWSLSDFIDVNNKSMQRSIDQLIENCEHHIFNCVKNFPFLHARDNFYIQVHLRMQHIGRIVYER